MEAVVLEGTPQIVVEIELDLQFGTFPTSLKMVFQLPPVDFDLDEH